MNSISTVAKYLNDNAAHLAAEIVAAIIPRLDSDVPKAEIEQAIVVYTEFIGFLGEIITCSEDRVPDGLIEWSKKNGEREAALRGRISSIIGRYPPTRVVFIEYISKITIEHELSTAEVVLINKRVNYLIDISINETILAFERLAESILKKTQEEINELSAPVVPIQAGIAVLPLIGTVDSERAEHLLNKAVPKISELNVRCLIMDFSGIITIDTEIASHIFTIYAVLRLLGISVIVTGIRPELANRIISAGIDFSSIKTYANVKQAIESMEL